MATRLVPPPRGDTISNFIEGDGDDQGDIVLINNYLLGVAFTDAMQGGVAYLTQLIVDHFHPEYVPILDTLLFHNRSAARFAVDAFAERVVEQDSNWIAPYLNLTQTPMFQSTDRRNLIQTLIDQAVSQHTGLDPRWDFLENILENFRLQTQPDYIQSAFTSSINASNNEFERNILIKYKNERNMLDLLVNGCIDSQDPMKFSVFNIILSEIGSVPGTALGGGAFAVDRQKLDGTMLTAADADTIADLKKTAAFSLTSTNLALVLQPANLTQVPELNQYLDPIRGIILRLGVADPLDPSLTGVPGHYLEQVTDRNGKTLAEKAAEVGNVTVINALITAGINVSSKPLMQIALTGQHYNVAQALWNSDHTYPDPWFPPGFIVNDAKLTQDTSAPYFFPWTDQFRNTFYNKYAVFNPGSASGVGRSTVARAVGIKPSYAPLPPTGQNDVADTVVRMLTAMPDFRPGSTKDTLNLLSLSSIRDELARVTDPAIWNSKWLLSLIAKKGAVADSAVLPNADLLRIGSRLGADVNQVDASGKSALHYVAALPVRKEGSRLTTPRAIFMLKTLLAAPNIDVNLADRNGNTALHLMMDQDQPSNELVTLLSRKKDCDYNLINTAGDTALNMLIKTRNGRGGGTDYPLKNSKDVLDILLPNTDITIRDAAGHTALWSAINTVPLMDEKFLLEILSGLAKGLTDRTAEKAVAASRGLNLINVALDTVATTSIPPANIPDWVPNIIKTILTGDSLELSMRNLLMEHIMAVDTYINNGTPSDFESLMDLLKSRYGPPSIWESFRQRVAPDEFTVKFNNTDPPIRLMSPYAPGAAYRDLDTTVYTSSGTPTLAAGTDPAAVTAAARNNDVLVKLVGRQYITPVHQPILKKILRELYHADANPSLGNDLTTLITNLFMKFETLEKADKAIQKHQKGKALAKLESSLTTFVGILLAGGRFPPSLPDALPFPAIVFTGRATHAPLFAAAAAVAGGGIPIMPGLRAVTTVPPPRPGLRSGSSRTGSGGGGGGGGGGGTGGPPPPALINTITGEPIDPRILATDFPTDITLGPDDALTYATPPITAASGFEVARSDPFYKFLQPFGLTAVFAGKAYILRPAELFLALFHKTQPQVAVLMRDRTHPVVTLLRDVCLPAAAQLAQRKGMTDSVTKLNVLRGRLPR